MKGYKIRLRLHNTVLEITDDTQYTYEVQNKVRKMELEKMFSKMRGVNGQEAAGFKD